VAAVKEHDRGWTSPLNLEELQRAALSMRVGERRARSTALQLSLHYGVDATSTVELPVAPSE
jgi:hypothetical protein